MNTSTYRLRDICIFMSGGTPSVSNKSFWNGDICWVSPKDMYSDLITDTIDHITDNAVKESATKIVPENSILVVARSGILVRRLPVAVTSKPMAFNQDIKAIIVNNDIAIPQYVAYYLKSKEKQILSSGVKKGATVHSIMSGYIENLTLKIPTISEQQRIVDILDYASSIQRLRKASSDKIKEIVPTLFVSMFGDPASNSYNLPLVRLGSIADVGSGNGFPLMQQGNKKGEIPFYKVSDMNSDGNETYMRKSNNYINRDVQKLLKSSVYRSGTVIFPKIGAAIATNKKRILTVDSCFDNNIMGITPGQDIVTEYVYGLLLLKNISDFASDSNPPSIRKTALEDWIIPLPPMVLQNKFKDMLGVLNNMTGLGRQASAYADLALTSVQSGLFR